MSSGPFESEDEARAIPEVRAVYEAYDHGFGTGNLSGAPLITSACEAAGVEIGAYDARTIEWMGNWEPHTCAVFAGLIRRAHDAATAPAVRLLEEALHLRQHGERAPGGNETWRDWDERAERYLRGLLPPEREGGDHG